MAPLVYLISGANRGIGLGLVEALIQRDNVIVFAGTRDPSKNDELQRLAGAHPERLHIIKLISTDRANNDNAISEIKAKAGRLDVVIANAGICNGFNYGAEVTAEAMTENFRINTLGPLTLFQASWSLLQSSTPTPKFIPISGKSSSIAEGASIPLAIIAFATSKTTLNYVTRKLYSENKNLIAFPIDPGLVNTDLTTEAAEHLGIPTDTAISVRQSVEGILREIDSASRETHGDALVRAAGGKWEW